MYLFPVRLFRPLSAGLLALFLTALTATGAMAQSAAVSGTVLDESGGAVSAARVSVVDDRGRVLRTTVTDRAGAFSIDVVPAGTYIVTVEKALFAVGSEPLVVLSSGPAGATKVVLHPGGYSESVVVSPRRGESRLAETPQKVEVVDGLDISRTVAADGTDLLKKTAGVDVIQYNGALSGIGIRGFRPQFSGINKRSLLLVDGRPSGITNLATLMFDNVERIEVVKGPASSVYGSSAMGGVVNVLTRRSRGRIGGAGRVGAGSFGSSEFAGRVGGSASSRVDFDLSGTVFDQRDDYRMGNGETRPATAYTTYNGAGRVGVDLGAWRLDANGSGYRGRDIMTPGELSSGSFQQGSKDLEQSSQDVRLAGRSGGHALSLTGYHTSEASHTSNVTSFDPSDAAFLPYLSFESKLTWAGVQARDTWNWSRLNSVVVGIDYEKVTSVGRSYQRSGERSAPFSADSNKRTVGFYAENTLRLRDGKTVLTVGGRGDRITTQTVDTPLKTNFTPSEATFTVFNPSAGLSQQLPGGLRAHTTVGRAFIPAEASMLTGFTTSVISGRTQITQGNPDLKPERSTSVDAGIEWRRPSTRVDVTVFRTVVKDRFVSNVVISNPAPPEPVRVSVTNGLDAHIGGLDFEAAHRVSRAVGVFGNITQYFTRIERLTSGAERDILSVPMHTLRAGVDVDLGRVSARVSGRFVHSRKDNDFNLLGFPVVTLDDVSVVDANVTYRLIEGHEVGVAINNLFDSYYYEALGYPLQGGSFRGFYRIGF